MIPTSGVLSLGMLDTAAEVAATVLLQTSLVSVAGLVVIAVVRRYGSLAQSFAARTVLLLLLAAPLTAPIVMHYRAVTVSLPALAPAQSVWTSPDWLPATAISAEPVTSPVPSRSLYTVMRDEDRSAKQLSAPSPNSVAADRSSGLPLFRNRTVPDVPPQLLQPAGTRTMTGWAAVRMMLYAGAILFWLCCSLVMLVRSIRAYRSLRELRTGLTPVSEYVVALSERLAAQLGVATPGLFQTPDLISPLVTGIRHPMLLLPDQTAVAGKKLEQVLVHELIHLKRHDQVWSHLSQAALVLLPIQPLVWPITRYLEETSDYVCDAVVTATIGDRRTYAETLLEIACRYPGNAAAPGFSAGLFSFASPLRRRITRIMSTVTDAVPQLRTRAVVIALICSLSSAAASGLVGVEMNSLEPVRRMMSLQSFAALWGAMASRTNERSAPPLHDGSGELAHVTRQSREPLVATSTPDTVPELREEPGARTYAALLESIQAVLGNRTASVQFESRTNEPPEHRVTTLSGGKSAQTVRSEHADDSYRYAAGGTGIPIGDARDDIAGNSFLAQHRGTPMPATAGQRIVMPVARPVLVEVPEYQNGMFDLGDDEQKAQYNLYASLDKNKNEPAWSADGRRIVFTDQNRIWIVPASGGAPELVFENFYYHDDRRFPIGGIESISFTPDGRSLIFKLDTYDIERGSRVAIRYLDEIRASAYFELPIPGIVRLDLETDELTLLADGGYNCAVSNDGAYLCYLAAALPDSENDPSRVHHPVLMDLVTGESFALNDEPDLVFGRPAFTPDGGTIIIPCREGTSAIELCRIPCTGGEPEYLTSSDKVLGGQFIGFPEVSPDGRWILYTDFTLVEQRPNKRLMLYSTVSGEQFEMFPEAEDRRSYGVWSPDGTHVCYLATEPGGNVLYISRFEPLMFKITVPVAVDEPETPLAFSLDEPYPNPFNSAVSIRFTIPVAGQVDLVIHNIMGQRIRELVGGQYQPGVHTVRWDGRDDRGQVVSSGIYFARIDAGAETSTKKMTLAK